MEENKLYADGLHDDTRAIQVLLDKRGEVNLPDGRYLISRPLIIHDNTHFKLAKNAYLRLADGANSSLIDNDGLYERRTNRNITIEGGIWDGNNAAQQRRMIDNENLPCDYDEYISNELIVILMRIVHCDNLTVKDITFVDPTSYATHFADVRYFRVENITFDFNLSKKNMDGIHIQGPARFGVIHNIMGDANDDHVALCANGTTRSEVTRGDIEDIDISGIYCKNGYTGVRLLSCGDAIRNIKISDIHGRFRFYAVSFTHHYPLRAVPPLLENITLRDLYISKSSETFPELISPKGALIWFESKVNVKNVVIENIFRKESCQVTEAPTIRISKDATAENLRIVGIHEEYIGQAALTIENEAGVAICKA